VIDGDFNIVPACTGKPAPDLVIQPNPAMPLQRHFHRRAQHIVALFAGDATARENADDVIGQLLDKLDHRAAPA